MHISHAAFVFEFGVLSRKQRKNVLGEYSNILNEQIIIVGVTYQLLVRETEGCLDSMASNQSLRESVIVLV